MREDGLGAFSLGLPEVFDDSFELFVWEKIRFEFSSGHDPPPSEIFQILPLHKISPVILSKIF
ncbi:hypothetical protein TDIS_1729 [Thermosulfurimonas dismutans]|uniref:Uncharacterized protein n=1 Tax=Thermosulfurimonas dismutans TaxID=999894 RepID=A0A179D2E3_9BACT|nr:hypothetical protein TDIS_1729 [Thermosulfurimonas dismutans]